jgi:hypothetical protein
MHVYAQTIAPAKRASKATLALFFPVADSADHGFVLRTA